MKHYFPAALFACALIGGGLVGCSTPDPVVVTKEVKIAVPTPCNPKLPDRPALMTKDQLKGSLAAAPNLDERVKILTTQVLLYIGWVPEIEAGLNGCKGAPIRENSGD